MIALFFSFFCFLFLSLLCPISFISSLWVFMLLCKHLCFGKHTYFLINSVNCHSNEDHACLTFPPKDIHLGERAYIFEHSRFISVIYWSLDSREIFGLFLSFYLQSDVIAEAEQGAVPNPHWCQHICLPSNRRSVLLEHSAHFLDSEHTGCNSSY